MIRSMTGFATKSFILTVNESKSTDYYEFKITQFTVF